MSLFSGPEEHAANPPETWMVVKAGPRSWHLVTQAGGVLEYAKTQREASALKHEGSSFLLYQKESRWYAGERVSGWKTWEQCKAEREKLEAWKASRQEGAGK